MKYVLIIFVTLFSYSAFSQQIHPGDSISIYLLNQDYEKVIRGCNDILQEDVTFIFDTRTIDKELT